MAMIIIFKHLYILRAKLTLNQLFLCSLNLLNSPKITSFPPKNHVFTSSPFHNPHVKWVYECRKKIGTQLTVMFFVPH